MKKYIMASAIIFLMIFTAGFATAANSLWPFTTTSGTLYFVAEGTGLVTSDQAAIITLNQAIVTSGQPNNFYYGTLTMTKPALVFNIAATLDEGIFNITGSSSSGGILRASATIYPRYDSALNKREQSIGIEGWIQDGTTFGGKFEGVLFE